MTDKNDSMPTLPRYAAQDFECFEYHATAALLVTNVRPMVKITIGPETVLAWSIRAGRLGLGLEDYIDRLCRRTASLLGTQ